MTVWLNLTLKIQVQCHCKVKVKVTWWVQQPIDSHPFRSTSIGLLFLGYCYFTIWHWKSNVKIIARGHIVGPTSYWLTSLTDRGVCLVTHTHTHTTPTHFFPPIPRPLFTFFSGTPAQNSNFCPRPPPIWPPPIFRQKPPYPRPH